MLTIGSLFSGIGGLDLGLEQAGLGPTLWQVEQNAFCRAVLAKHWPNAERFDDVCKVGAAQLAPVDLVCGGFPCQDVSSAGTRVGLGGARSGLWFEFRRIVAELRPTWVVIENVASGAGLWLDAVRESLEQLGYGSLFVPLAASDCGAPHRRARIFVVAHAHGDGELQSSRSEREERGRVDHGAAADAQCVELRIQSGLLRGSSGTEAGLSGDDGSVGGADADAHGQRGVTREGCARPERPGRFESSELSRWSSEPGVVPVVHGLSGGLAGRRRRARIRALGNAVTPPQAQVIGHVIRLMLEAA